MRLPEGEPSPRNTQSIPKEPAASQPQHWEAFIRGVLESSLGHRAADAAQDTFDANDGSREVGCWAAGWKWRCLSRWPVQISNILNLCLECVNTLIHDKGMFEGLTLDKPLFYQRPFRLAHSYAAHTMPGLSSNLREHWIMGNSEPDTRKISCSIARFDHQRGNEAHPRIKHPKNHQKLVL